MPTIESSSSIYTSGTFPQHMHDEYVLQIGMCHAGLESASGNYSVERTFRGQYPAPHHLLFPFDLGGQDLSTVRDKRIDHIDGPHWDDVSESNPNRFPSPESTSEPPEGCTLLGYWFSGRKSTLNG